MSDLSVKIMSCISNYNEATKGKCGLSAQNISGFLKIDLIVLKPILNQLYKNKKIKIKEGINSKLIFKNDR